MASGLMARFRQVQANEVNGSYFQAKIHQSKMGRILNFET